MPRSHSTKRASRILTGRVSLSHTTPWLLLGKKRNSVSTDPSMLGIACDSGVTSQSPPGREGWPRGFGYQRLGGPCASAPVVRASSEDCWNCDASSDHPARTMRGSGSAKARATQMQGKATYSGGHELGVRPSLAMWHGWLSRTSSVYDQESPFSQRSFRRSPRGIKWRRGQGGGLRHSCICLPDMAGIRTASSTISQKIFRGRP